MAMTAANTIAGCARASEGGMGVRNSGRRDFLTEMSKSKTEVSGGMKLGCVGFANAIAEVIVQVALFARRASPKMSSTT